MLLYAQPVTRILRLTIDRVEKRNALDDGLVRYRVALANLQTLTGN